MSDGPRTCVGASFASLALRLALPLIVQRFRLAYRKSDRIRGDIHELVDLP